MDAQILYAFGTVLIVVGIILLIVVVALISIREDKNGKTKAAGIILIGPIPIVFGTDKKSVKTVIVLTLTLTVTAVVAMIAYYFLLR